MESLPLEILALLFFAGIVSGFVDSVAGGGGLISLPVLLMAGLPPVAALATSKAQAMFGSFTAMQRYAKMGYMNMRDMKLPIALTFIGSASGTLLVQVLDPNVMMQVIPFLLIVVALYFAFGPKIGDVDHHQLMHKTPFFILFGLALGFYDGFFGPGTGSLWALAFVAVLGFNMLKATAHTKVVNFTSNFTSFLFFAFAGYVMWLPALVMAAGQLIGASIGANMAMKHGARLIKPLLVVVSLLITTKLVMDDPNNILHVWVVGLLI